MKKTKLKVALVFMFLSFALSPSLYAQGEIEPPPTAPIDQYILPAAIFAVFLGMYLVFKRNLKSETK